MSDDLLATILFIIVYLVMSVVQFCASVHRKHRKPTKGEVFLDCMAFPGMMAIAWVIVILSGLGGMIGKLFKGRCK